MLDLRFVQVTPVATASALLATELSTTAPSVHARDNLGGRRM
jgi:hypothetical protein